MTLCSLALLNFEFRTFQCPDSGKFNVLNFHSVTPNSHPLFGFTFFPFRHFFSHASMGGPNEAGAVAPHSESDAAQWHLRRSRSCGRSLSGAQQKAIDSTVDAVSTSFPPPTNKQYCWFTSEWRIDFTPQEY